MPIFRKPNFKVIGLLLQNIYSTFFGLKQLSSQFDWFNLYKLLLVGLIDTNKALTAGHF